MPDTPPTSNPLQALAGGGEMGQRIRAFDWSSTSLGDIGRWPDSLKTSLSLILNSQMPMWIGWGDDAVFFYNDAYVQVLGQAKHPWALGRPASVVWAEIWDVCGPLAERVFRHAEAPFVEDVRLFMNRGDRVEEVYYSFSYSPIRDERGGVAGLFCPNTEVTAKLLNARRLRTLSELSARSLVEKTIAAACASAADTLARNPDDVPFALLYLRDGDGPHLRLEQAVRIAAGSDALWPLAEVLASGLARLVDVPAGADLPLGLAGQPVRCAVVRPVIVAGHDQALGVLVAGVNPTRDLDTEYATFFELLAAQVATAIQNATAAEQERRRADLLAEIDRAKTTFFSNVSHEFRTPLTLMLGPTEDALASPTRALEGAALETVYRNELRLLKLVNALLDFSRLEAGRMVAQRELVDLAALTTDLASHFRAAIERAGLRFEVDTSALSRRIAVDRDMWEKIVLNLLSNALKFTLHGVIRISLRQHGGAVELRVTDTGSGIPADEMPRLFERFHRIENQRARTHEGSGIGLALVQELVRLHRGDVTVQSEPGQGSEFLVSIPLAGDALAEGGAAAAPSPASVRARTAYVEEAQRWSPAAAPPVEDVPAADDPAGGHVLYADDNPDMRDYVRRLLESHWRVTTVSDGFAAVEAVRHDQPDLVLTDVMMPGLGGFEVLAALRADERTRAIPVIMLSARAGDEASVEGLGAGADDYLVKPFSARELVARVRTHLTLSRLRRRSERELAELYGLFMQVPGAITVRRGPELRCVFQNAAAVRWFDQRGRTLREAEAALPAELAELQRSVVRTGGTRVLREAGGTRVWEGDLAEARFWDVTYVPLRLADGTVDGVMTLAFEVTDRVEARQRAEDASRAKDEFLAMLGHELRNPLAPIVTAVQLMKLRGGGVSREQQTIERQVNHLTRLVDDLLDISRVTRGLIELKPERLVLGDVIARALEIASPLMEQKGHFVSVDVPRGLHVDADPVRLAQVFANLLTNAARYTRAGGRIEITASQDDDLISVRVGDNGNGIGADMLTRIFDLFVQEGTSKDRSEGGLGIGLALVRTLVQKHGGEVFAQSAGPGLGSQFTVRLPAAAPAVIPEIVETAALPHPAEARRGSRRVLLVDDNIDAAEVLGDALREMGHAVTVAHDGPQALQVAAEVQPEIAVLDIGLPVMDGYELARQLRDRGLADCRMIALTGYGQEQDHARSRDAGFHVHLVKPVDLSRLLREVESDCE